MANKTNICSDVDLVARDYKLFGENDIAVLFKEFCSDLNEINDSISLQLIIKKYLSSDIDCTTIHIDKEPSAILHLISLSSSIFIALEDESDRLKILQNAARHTMARLVHRLRSSSIHQLSKLFEGIDKVVSIIESKNLNKNDICILELPIGNSIPCKLLAHIFEIKGIAFSKIVIALNRNDSKTKGKTRENLIKERFLQPNSFVIYMDEWITGTNFYNINKILSKVPKIKILPVAYLRHDSLNQIGYLKYKEKHNEFCSKIGLNGESLRFVVPKMNETVVSEQPFMWAEYDRIAGYRKYEVVGSIFTAIKSTIGDIIENPHLLNYILDRLPSENRPFKEDIKSNLIKASEIFINSFSDVWEAELMKSDYFNEERNLKEMYEASMKIAERLSNYSEVKFAIASAGQILEDTNIDSINRYYFKGFAPMCWPLVDSELALHQTFMEELFTAHEEYISK